MKILLFFIDMLRPNCMRLFNPRIPGKTPFDTRLEKLGGTLYTNCFTPGPDTPRSLSSLYSGLPPAQNGCSTRVKWPGVFLKEGLPTFFHLLRERDYGLHLFSKPVERRVGLYPADIDKIASHNRNLSLAEFLRELPSETNQLIFIANSDFHTGLSLQGATRKGMNRALREAAKTWDIFFDICNPNQFDHIFVFSDHGFKFTSEQYSQPNYLKLNEDRCQILMLHRQRGQSGLNSNTKLSSILDVFPTFQEILGIPRERRISLLSKEEHPFLIAEDHYDFRPQVNQNIDAWSVVTNEHIYIRELAKGYLLDRRSGRISPGEKKSFDELLMQHATFAAYQEENEKIFRHREIEVKPVYISGSPPKEAGRTLKRIRTVIKFILKRGRGSF